MRIAPRCLVSDGWWGDFHARVVSLGLDPARLVPRERRASFALVGPDGKRIVFRTKAGETTTKADFEHFLSTFASKVDSTNWKVSDGGYDIVLSLEDAGPNPTNLSRQVGVEVKMNDPVSVPVPPEPNGDDE